MHIRISVDLCRRLTEYLADRGGEEALKLIKELPDYDKAGGLYLRAEVSPAPSPNSFALAEARVVGVTYNPSNDSWSTMDAKGRRINVGRHPNELHALAAAIEAREKAEDA